MVAVVQAFGPFGALTANPSELVVRSLARHGRPGVITADGGPAAHLTTLPVEAILRAWREAGFSGYLSHNAVPRPPAQ